MLKTVGQFVKELLERQTEPQDLSEQDMRLAAAALLVHAMVLDGAIEEAETARLQQVLQEHFALSDEETDELIIAAGRREREAVDLYGFTSTLKRKTTEEQRLQLIEMMWRIAFADGALHEFEDNLLWRTAELLGVSPRDRLRLKKLVKEQAKDQAKEQAKEQA